MNDYLLTYSTPQDWEQRYTVSRVSDQAPARHKVIEARTKGDAIRIARSICAHNEWTMHSLHTRKWSPAIASMIDRAKEAQGIAARRLTDDQLNDIYISAKTGNLQDIRQAVEKALGTFSCPICGATKPHHHTKDEVQATRLMAMPEAEVDAELRRLGIDPDEAARQGKAAVEGALEAIRARKGAE